MEREGQIILEGSCLAVGADGSGSYGTGGALAATFGYDSYGLPSSTVTGSVQHYSYSFDPVKGNLLSRKNEKNGMQEGFSYDSLDRLTWVSRGSSPFHNTVYDDNGNITSKSDAGTLSYENSNRPFQVTKLVSNNTSYGANQTVSYNSFEKVSSIGEGSYGATFVYDSAGERVKMNVTQNGASILARTYIGSRYIREVQNGVTKEYTFIGGDGYSAPAVIMQQGGVKTRYYLLRDHLGSVTHVVDNSGSVLNEYSFDAWGRQRNVSTWIHYAADTEPALFMGRGYTGHEHLPWFNLVNMNGRLYDPVVGRFLSPDPFVQLPEFSQNFNRYSYCLNNPLKYNDPDGELVWLLPALIGGVINVATNWKNLHGNFWDKVGQGALYFGTGAVQGGLSVLGPAGWAAGGAFAGSANAAIGGANGAQIFQQGLVGGISGLAGGTFGKWAGQHLGGVVINGFHVSANSAIGGAVTGAIGGAAGGYVGGFTGGFMMTGNLRTAHQSGVAGLATGAAIGGGIGAAYGYYSAKEAGRNPWTGKFERSVVIGRQMENRVNPAASDLGAETITKTWNEEFGEGFRVSDSKGIQFNRRWYSGKLNDGYRVYDIGSGGLPTGKYYGAELSLSKGYWNVSKTNYWSFFNNNIRIIYYGK